MRAVRCLDRFQISVTISVLLMAFRGRGSHATFVAMFLTLPLLRLAHAPYRARWRERLTTAMAALRSYGTDSDGEPVPWRELLLLVVVPALCLNVINGRAIPSMDNYPVNMTAASLVLHGTPNAAAITPVAAQGTCATNPPLPYSVFCSERGVYSNYPAGMLTFALPVFAVARLLGADVADASIQWRLAKWAGAWLSAVAIAIVTLINLQFVSAEAALVVAGLLATGSAFFSTIGQGLWSQGGVVFGTAVFLACELAPRWRRHRFSPLVEGIALSVMAASRLNSATVILPLALWAFFRAPRRAIMVGIWALVAYVPWGAYYYGIEHNIFGPQLRMGRGQTWAGNFWRATVGVLASPARGLFIYQSWALLALTPLVSRARPALWKSLAVACGVAIVLQVILLGTWSIWWGGACWGSRLAAETIPLFAILVAPRIDWFLARGAGRATVALLLALGFFFHATGAILDGGAWDLAAGEGASESKMFDWSDPPFLYPFTSLLSSRETRSKAD